MMRRDVRLGSRGLGRSSFGVMIAVAVLLSSCGGGGGGGGSSPIQLSPTPGGPTPTATPLQTVSSRNERTEASSAGSITLRVQDIDLVNSQISNFSVFLFNTDGSPAANQHLTIDAAGLDVVPAAAETGSDGSLSGTMSATSSGSFPLTVSTDPGAPFNGLSVTLTINAVTSIVRVPTPTASPTTPEGPTEVPTPFPTGQDTFTPTIAPSPTPTVPLGSIAFIGALPATIGVRASGLPEQSVVTFQAKNTLSQPIVGAPVSFQLTGSGSEILNPNAAVTDAKGMVSTTVTSGFRATTVRITAEADSNGDGTPDIFVQSQVVGIVGAPPAFNHFSLAAAKLNIHGRVLFGLDDEISAFVNDRFGNAVPPETSVSFVTNAASVVDPKVTNSSGVATATLLSEGVVPPTGIVTVLGFTRGEESFLDNNGNGKFDCSPEPNPPCHSEIDSLGPVVDGHAIFDDTSEPFIDFRPLDDGQCTVAPPSNLCNDMFDADVPLETFVDSNENGLFDSLRPAPAGNGFGQGTDGLWDNNIFVWDAIPVTFSGPLVTPVASPTSFAVPIGGSQLFTIEVHDDLLNPIVGGSTISVSSAVGTISGGSITVPDGESFNQIVDGLTRFSFVLSAGENVGPPVNTSIVVTISSPNGNGTFVVASGTVPKSS
jgi:hypothetical protein